VVFVVRPASCVRRRRRRVAPPSRAPRCESNRSFESVGGVLLGGRGHGHRIVRDVLLIGSAFSSRTNAGGGRGFLVSSWGPRPIPVKPFSMKSKVLMVVRTSVTFKRRCGHFDEIMIAGELTKLDRKMIEGMAKQKCKDCERGLRNT